MLVSVSATSCFGIAGWMQCFIVTYNDTISAFCAILMLFRVNDEYLCIARILVQTILIPWWICRYLSPIVDSDISASFVCMCLPSSLCLIGARPGHSQILREETNISGYMSFKWSKTGYAKFKMRQLLRFVDPANWLRGVGLLYPCTNITMAPSPGLVVLAFH